MFRWIGYPVVNVIFLLGMFSSAADAGDNPVHGIWVWKTPSVLAAPGGAEALRDFCQARDINEVYVSVSAIGDPAVETQIVHLVTLLHRSKIRVEALLSGIDADEPGKERQDLLERVRGVVQFNQRHPEDRFEGIHLDIEPQQRPENKGAGNLRFLPGLVEAFRAVRLQADKAQLTVNADIQNKLLKGTLEERRMLLSSLPRLTLMLYELSSPGDRDSREQKMEKLRAASRRYLEMAYQGLGGTGLARIAIAPRTPDYVDLLPAMLTSLDRANGSDRNYLGWAMHSYNDTLGSAR